MTDTDRRSRRAAERKRPVAPPPQAPDFSSGLRPWHFFLLATLTLVTVSVVLMRQQTADAIAFVALTVAAAGWAAYGVYRTLTPLAGGELDDTVAMVGGRTRAALERDKGLTLRAIKELEFDHAMGKVADGDFADMRDRLRQRAMRLIRQLDGAEAYRQAIERDLASLVPPPPATAAPVEPAAGAAHAPVTVDRVAVFCTHCGAPAAADDRFCRMCGTALRAPVGVQS